MRGVHQPFSGSVWVALSLFAALCPRLCSVKRARFLYTKQTHKSFYMMMKR
jgi:hypothetical protein